LADSHSEAEISTQMIITLSSQGLIMKAVLAFKIKILNHAKDPVVLVKGK